MLESIEKDKNSVKSDKEKIRVIRTEGTTTATTAACFIFREQQSTRISVRAKANRRNPNQLLLRNAHKTSK